MASLSAIVEVATAAALFVVRRVRWKLPFVWGIALVINHMYAVLRQAASSIHTENTRCASKTDNPVGDQLSLTHKMVITDDENVVAAPDALKSARIVAQIEGHGRERDSRLQEKRRKGHERMNGHCQAYTLIQTIKM